MKKFDLVRNAFFLFSAFGLAAVVIDFWSRRRLSIVSWLLVLIISTGMFALVDMYFIEPNWLAVEKVTVHDEGLAGSMQGLSVVQLSDLHLRGKPGLLERRLVAEVNALQPDLLLITGDFLDDIGRLRETIELLRSFKVKAGIYGVLGNTDHHFFRTRGLIKELQDSGITMLMNENRRVSLPNGRHLWLAGVDDPVTGRARLEHSLDGIPTGEPVLLLAHSPDIYVLAVLARVNMVLAGHTHGGQVGIPYLIRRSDYANRSPFMAGMFHDGSTTLYVNRGIGTKTLPIRFICRPEITTFQFR
ncbi:MAG: metallophosphoesterase [Verrucomicrobia bacterium]|nr:metallophosphoesterase [Deltaproteobacteria bacterium]